MNPFWAQRRVLITGATGLVGAWLTRELLKHGANVVALVRDANQQSELFRSGDIQRVSVVTGALEDFLTLERAINRYEVDTVFHLGAQAIVGTALRSPVPTFEANIRGTYNVLEACRLHSTLVKRLVIASSDKAYGHQPVLPYTETMSLVGRHPYEVSKSCADLITQAYHHTYGLPVAIARCGNIYGGGDLNWSRIVPGTIRSLIRKSRPIIRSNGVYVRDYIYVKDVVLAYMRLAELLSNDAVRGEAFNFAPDKPTTVLEIVGAIRRLMDCDDLEPDVRNTAEGEIHDQYLSSAKACQVLGWTPAYDMDSGLMETIDWYRAFVS